MNFAARIIRLADQDLPRIGYTIGVGEDPVHAFLDVETAGGGYDKHGRLKALYEPHRAYKNAGKISTAMQARFVKAELAYPTWGAKPYPADSYPRIMAACSIDETVALLSTSWGIGQVLGENFRAAGYASVQIMLRAYLDGGEAEQLESAVRFIKANKLDDDLQKVETKIRAGRKVTEADFTPFAVGYNGKSQAKHGYARKLADRANWWARKPDTPWQPPKVPVGYLPTLDIVEAPTKSTAISALDVTPGVPASGVPASKGFTGWLAKIFKRAA